VSEIQALHLRLLRLSSFNRLDGNEVADDLEASPELWAAALIAHPDIGAVLDAVFRGESRADTLLLLPREGMEADLEALAGRWGADEVVWERIGQHDGWRMRDQAPGPAEGGGVDVLRLWWG
jgi:hypothetical protein